jgi:exonuclease VII small subunit
VCQQKNEEYEKKEGWETAIQDAKEMISSLESKIKGLRESIQVFEQDRDAGTPWPGDKELAIHRKMG